MSALLCSECISQPCVFEKIQEGFSFYASHDRKTAAPGTCGELVQGIFQGSEFLVNSPIPSHATAAIKIFKGTDVQVLGEGNWSKVKRAVEFTLSSHSGGKNIGAIVQVHSALPRGKGFASSTAEMTAAIYAVGKALSLDFSSEFITSILLEIDRSTDAVYLPGISAVHHLRGKEIVNYGNPPPLGFIAVDDGGEVETCAFDRERARAISSNYQDFYSWALKSLKNSFATGSSSGVAKIATESARINQNILYKNLFEDLLKGTSEVGALGVNCAHTGSALGVMFDPTNCDLSKLTARVKEIAGKERLLGIFPLIGGGLASSQSFQFKGV